MSQLLLYQLMSSLKKLMVLQASFLSKADDQLGWRVLQSEKLARLREKLHLKREQYLQGNTKIEKMSCDLKVKYELLESAMTVLERNRVEQLEKFYPNLICTQSLGHGGQSLYALEGMHLEINTKQLMQLSKDLETQVGVCTRRKR